MVRYTVVAETKNSLIMFNKYFDGFMDIVLVTPVDVKIMMVVGKGYAHVMEWADIQDLKS